VLLTELCLDHLQTLEQLSVKLNSLMATGDPDELRIYLGRVALVMKRHIATEGKVLFSVMRASSVAPFRAQLMAFSRDSASWTLAIDAFQEIWCCYGAIERNRTAFIRATKALLAKLRRQVEDLHDLCSAMNAHPAVGTAPAALPRRVGDLRA